MPPSPTSGGAYRTDQHVSACRPLTAANQSTSQPNRPNKPPDDRRPHYPTDHHNQSKVQPNDPTGAAAVQPASAARPGRSASPPSPTSGGACRTDQHSSARRPLTPVNQLTSQPNRPNKQPDDHRTDQHTQSKVQPTSPTGAAALQPASAAGPERSAVPPLPTSGGAYRTDQHSSARRPLTPVNQLTSQPNRPTKQPDDHRPHYSTNQHNQSKANQMALQALLRCSLRLRRLAL